MNSTRDNKIMDAIGTTVGWTSGGVVILALIGLTAGWIFALIAALACFCTVGALVGLDRWTDLKDEERVAAAVNAAASEDDEW